MADIKNYTLNFGSGRALRALDFAVAKSAFTEVQRGSLSLTMVVYG
jgi:hypothetical protein